MKTPVTGWKFPLCCTLFALAPLTLTRGQSAPAKAPAHARKPAAAAKKTRSAPAAADTQFPLAAPVKADGEARYAGKRAQVLLAEERRDPALLAGLLSDADKQIRARAARALGRIGAPGAAEGLAKLLADDAPETQAAAAWGALYLGAAARPLIPKLRSLAQLDHPARIPALETLIALGDTGSEQTVLEALEAAPMLRYQFAGHLFRLDTPAIRALLKDWARINQDEAIQVGAMASLVRLKLDDEFFYRELLIRRQGEAAVWAVKGLGLAKKPAPETIAFLEQAAKRKNDPMTRMEAYGQLSKFSYKKYVRDLITDEKLPPDDMQLMISIYDGYNKTPCDQLDPVYPWVLMGSDENHKAQSAPADPLNLSRNKCYIWGSECAIKYPALMRRHEQANLRCMKKLKEFGNMPKFWGVRTKQSVAEMLADYEGKEYNPVFLDSFSKEEDSRVRSGAAAALVQRGGSANAWLSDKSAEVVANVADAASHLKPEELTDKRLSGDELMKAYQRFSVKDAEDGPNTRLYLVRAAAACAAIQPACLNLLKAAQSDTVRTVQINAWERWPEAEALRKQRPEWPRPNLPPPDFAGAKARLESLLHGPQRFEVETTQGKFTMVFTARGESPLNVLNFRALAAKKYFDGIGWHRVVPNFVVQTGDPRGDGSGGPGWVIPCEVNSYPYKAGIVGMALDGKDTGGSQWFVTLAAQPHLDFHYTILGYVDTGLDILYKLGEDDKIVTLREITPDPPVETKP